jgi:hypothetical protein
MALGSALGMMLEHAASIVEDPLAGRSNPGQVIAQAMSALRHACQRLHWCKHGYAQGNMVDL